MNQESIIIILFIIIFTVFGGLYLKYSPPIPKISYIKNLSYTYQLSIELLTGKTIHIPVYSDIPDLQLRQLASYWKTEENFLTGKVIYFSTADETYSIPENQILSKKLELVDTK